MRATRFICASMVTAGLLVGPASAQTAENAQDLQQQVDQLRRDFEAVKQQYADRLAALKARIERQR